MKKMTMFLFWNSFIMALSSNSFFFIWVAMEVNTMMFIPNYKTMNNTMTKSMMKYFIIQSISSSMFLFSYLLIKHNMWENSFLYLVIMNSLMIKMGLFPYSSWFFQISENMNWKQWFLLNTSQKLMPLYLLSNHFNNSIIFILMITMNIFYSTMEIWNQTSMRWMINSSSLNHFSWMLISTYSQNSFWEVYFFIYLILSFSLMKFMEMNNLNSMMNMMNNFNNKYIIYAYFTLMLNFMGIPPFLGFIPKIILIMENHMPLMNMVLIMNNLIIMMLYFYFCLPLMINSMKNKLNSMKMNYSMLINTMNMLFLVMIIMY